MPKRHYIEKRMNLAGYGFGGLWVFIFAAVLLVFIVPSQNSVAENIGSNLLVLMVVILLGLFALYRLRNQRFKRRRQYIDELASQYGWHRHITEVTKQQDISFNAASMTHLSEDKLSSSSNEIFTSDWAYCDYSYPIYHETKYGRYKAGEVLYAAMATRLPRKLPNVLFDSSKSRKRQFRFLFSKSQKHSLEGDFDKHFTTYFPEQYTVDSMSFISPDVMIALRDASDYDFEIQDDVLYMFGSMYDPREQISDMSAKLMKIKQELLDNVLTYRDERVAYADGRKTVHAQGLRLKRSRWREKVAVVIFVFWLVSYLLDILF